ncbi:MAG: Elongation factor Ts [Microgenomates group bacterium GW2011_GWA1_46_15]|nr:MAG: Elongation factor Ts [Microgenomates group bacterium GW2011_GWB1_45_17]KKU24201.1 MAG: Elongation factor Ts [Microgenomates group bacterium GW2011_GWC1_46_15]KKU24917.1 MAG: Elongation factor Ts [Microgenomates group bacterium GW2011_GWA1_46_15]
MAKVVSTQTISMDVIKKLREKTGAGVMDAKKALEESRGDMKKAEAWILAKGIARAEKKADREAKQGMIATYSHMGGRISTLVELNCETDFVARTQDFQDLGHELAMQVASMNPNSVEELLKQEYIRNPKLSIRDFVKSVAGKVGENIVVTRLARFAVGESSTPQS